MLVILEVSPATADHVKKHGRHMFTFMCLAEYFVGLWRYWIKKWAGMVMMGKANCVLGKGVWWFTMKEARWSFQKGPEHWKDSIDVERKWVRVCVCVSDLVCPFAAWVRSLSRFLTLCSQQKLLLLKCWLWMSTDAMQLSGGVRDHSSPVTGSNLVNVEEN